MRDRWGLILGALALLVRLAFTPSYGSDGVEGDLIEQKQAVHVALEQGFHEVYRANARADPALTGREWDGGYFTNYPPVIHYLRAATGWIYRWVSPEGFALWPPELNFLQAEGSDLEDRLAGSRGFTVAMKLPGVLADALLAFGLYRSAAAQAGPRTGRVVGAAYALNPGIVFDTAHWGQHDAVAAGFLVLGLVLVHRGRLEAGWVVALLGALSKPQINAFAPWLLALGVLRFPLRRVLLGGVAVLAAAALVFLPFVLGGTLGLTLEALWRSTLGGEPFVSSRACNFWWLWSGGRGDEVPDTAPLLGPLTPRALGLATLLAAGALSAWRLRRRPDPRGTELFLGAAVVGMSFFTFVTELHENHMMLVLPLLGFSLAGRPRLGSAFAVLSVTFLLNLALFDETAMGPLSRWLGSAPPVRAVSTAVAALNTGACVALWWVFWRGEPGRPRGRSPSSPAGVAVSAS